MGSIAKPYTKAALSFLTKNIWSTKAWPEQVARLAGRQAEVKV